jgi:hypothetical protein
MRNHYLAPNEINLENKDDVSDEVSLPKEISNE